MFNALLRAKYLRRTAMVIHRSLKLKLYYKLGFNVSVSSLSALIYQNVWISTLCTMHPKPVYALTSVFAIRQLYTTYKVVRGMKRAKNVKAYLSEGGQDLLRPGAELYYALKKNGSKVNIKGGAGDAFCYENRALLELIGFGFRFLGYR